MSWTQFLGWSPGLGFPALLSACSRPRREKRRLHPHLFPPLSTLEVRRSGNPPPVGGLQSLTLPALSSLEWEWGRFPTKKWARASLVHRGIIKQFMHAAGSSLAASACWEPRHAMHLSCPSSIGRVMLQATHTCGDTLAMSADNIGQRLFFKFIVIIFYLPANYTYLPLY